VLAGKRLVNGKRYIEVIAMYWKSAGESHTDATVALAIATAHAIFETTISEILCKP
jgi:hypothetical protein